MTQERFDSWAIVELFGHTRVAGRVTNQSIGGCSFVRVDVPETKNGQAFTKLYGSGAIYGMTLTDEQTARAAAEHFAPEPFSKFEIQRYLLPEGKADEDEDDFDDEDDRPF